MFLCSSILFTQKLIYFSSYFVLIHEHIKVRMYKAIFLT